MYEKCQSGSRQYVAFRPGFYRKQVAHIQLFELCFDHRAFFNIENNIDATISDFRPYILRSGLQISGINLTQGAVMHNTQNNAQVNSFMKTYRTVLSLWDSIIFVMIRSVSDYH